MKILVIIRAVVDNNTMPQISLDTQQIDTRALKISINSYDERAVEAAVKLKRQLADTSTMSGTISVLAIGSNTETILRASLARGADDAFQVNCPPADDDLSLARIIEFCIKHRQIATPDLILLGHQSTDTDTLFLAPMLAQLLDYSLATDIYKIIIGDTINFVFNNGDTGVLEHQMVLSVSHMINTPSFLKLPDIIAAKKKPLNIIEIPTEHYQQLADDLLSIEKVHYPDNKRDCKFIQYDELLSLLKLHQQENGNG